ncbi:DUF7285 family protein [Natronobacterium gregoryi]|uniref:Uncharacterized protein n=2 Tax=Natronobacterium gregoryi TaxID=44930 RepID=L0AFD5_NATGS|nr:hypothetical protein [Natronobacterium gregoryi]AFZ72551.1 hypothetical protein Natgr_1334 [Natronobacterium gregoryi SP2]ELY74161.1 hypothetical protein C490_00630 [Natronobacterium gregoryi SP2]PLK21519.1 hypothetical protein CYV19_04320 [Natronobacterium gregoryi SP2]SFI75661.1 hypothetical protein SAMN05443661_1057 [Natronobacterium gregoryi]
MSRSSTHRGQTEPLAALVAVAVIGVAVGLYGGYLTGTLSETTDRTSADVALERVWQDISRSGVFASADDSELDPIADRIELASLPEGENVRVAVTTVQEGEEQLVTEARFDADGTALEPDTLEAPPSHAGVAKRPIPVALEPGAVRGGTLSVEVWSP